MTDHEGTGIAHESQIGEYVQDTYGGTVSSMMPEDRAAQLLAEVNENLAREGVPGVYWQWGASGNLSGEFDTANWMMTLNDVNFGDPEGEYDTTVLTARHHEVAETVYHEARHAEQCFRCCRERAGLGATPEQIYAAMDLGSTPVPPMWVIEMAAQNPILQCDPSQYEAEQWYRSMYGEDADARRDALTTGTYDEYRALPEEADAWQVGDDVTDAYRQQENQ